MPVHVWIRWLLCVVDMAQTIQALLELRTATCSCRALPSPSAPTAREGIHVIVGVQMLDQSLCVHLRHHRLFAKGLFSHTELR